MLIAGEPSGDLLAAELVRALKTRSPDLECFGAGGPNMEAAGVELAFDMTRHAVIGLWEVIGKYFEFRRSMNELLRLAVERRPDVIVCVDFGGFNSRFAGALRDYERHFLSHLSWKPGLVQFVSPQVWASRPGRADDLARNFDQLLCILPFEKAWWAKRVPGFPVEFVGHPIVGRHAAMEVDEVVASVDSGRPVVALMPGSRGGELRKHLPVIADAARRIAMAEDVEFRLLLSNAGHRVVAERAVGEIPNCEIQIGDAGRLLRSATVALSKTGTITLECALHGLPTVTFYKTSPLTYFIGKRVVTVPFLTMPNLLAEEAVFPEFVQDEASPANLAAAVVELLRDTARREAVRRKLTKLTKSLGGPGAADRAAEAVLKLIGETAAKD